MEKLVNQNYATLFFSCPLLFTRGVVPGGAGGAGGAMAPPDFGRSVNPISTRWTNYAHLITTGTPGFSDLPTALFTLSQNHFFPQSLEA